jgi:hypothetical protein
MTKYIKDVFVYRFDQPPENATVEGGTGHFQEVAFVFSNPLPTQNPLSKRTGDKELGRWMTSSWVSFVHDLNPDFNGRESNSRDVSEGFATDRFDFHHHYRRGAQVAELQKGEERHRTPSARKLRRARRLAKGGY